MPVVRYFAAIRAEAGVDEEQLSGHSLADLLATARSSRGERFAEVLSICSFLIDGEPAGARDHQALAVADGSTVDCLPPFAGG